MKNRPLMFLGIAAIVAQGFLLYGCSSEGSSGTGTGGTTGSGGSTTPVTTGSGGTGTSTGAGGTGVSTGTGTGTGGTGVSTGTGGTGSTSPGSCDGTANPDITLNCTSANAKSNMTCTKDCCIPCGIDSAGSKVCTCAGGVYSNCSCLPPATGYPPGLQGGPCMPQGSSSASAADTLKGKPCTVTNAVCFTSDSTPSSERGCICMADGILHCGSVNHWFVNNGVPTMY